jgi:hypothetical protein
MVAHKSQVPQRIMALSLDVDLPMRSDHRGPLALPSNTLWDGRRPDRNEWDARRFFERALSDEVEAGRFERAELNDWQPA